jgi:diaminopimelate decarboxylase
VDAPATPYYLLDERRLEANLNVVEQVRERSGARSVLALKCFSTWSVFPLMRRYLDGTTSSSLNEARLGHEEFGGEVHAYSVAFDVTRSPRFPVRRQGDLQLGLPARRPPRRRRHLRPSACG